MLNARTQRGASPTAKPRLATGRRRGLLLVLAGVAGGLLVAACGSKDLPPSLPRTQIYQRFAPRVELVELIIKEPQRADAVKQLYIEIEDTFYAQGVKAVKDFQALSSHKEQISDQELRSVFDQFRTGERAAYEHYIAVQMKLRQTVSADEFARLNKLR